MIWSNIVFASYGGFFFFFLPKQLYFKFHKLIFPWGTSELISQILVFLSLKSPFVLD